MAILGSRRWKEVCTACSDSTKCFLQSQFKVKLITGLCWDQLHSELFKKCTHSTHISASLHKSVLVHSTKLEEVIAWTTIKLLPNSFISELSLNAFILLYYIFNYDQTSMRTQTTCACISHMYTSPSHITTQTRSFYINMVILIHIGKQDIPSTIESFPPYSFIFSSVNHPPPFVQSNTASDCWPSLPARPVCWI